MFILIAGEEIHLKVEIAVISLVVNLAFLAFANFLNSYKLEELKKSINNRTVDILMLGRKSSRFVPVSQQELVPGHIIKVKNGQIFPCDCLIVEINSRTEKRNKDCRVSRGPFDTDQEECMKEEFLNTPKSKNSDP